MGNKAEKSYQGYKAQQELESANRAAAYEKTGDERFAPLSPVSQFDIDFASATHKKDYEADSESFSVSGKPAFVPWEQTNAGRYQLEQFRGTNAAPAESTPDVAPDETTQEQSAEPSKAREQLIANMKDPENTLAEQGLLQETLPIELRDQDIIKDPTMFNVAPSEFGVDANGDRVGTINEAGELVKNAALTDVQQAEATDADAAADVIARDYEASLISPDELASNLQRLQDEEPMVAASMTTELNALMAGMENGEIPLWAKPAVTKVEQQLAARGISASSIGRDALFNSIINAAMPIAQQNASFKQDANKANYASKVQAIFSDVGAENAAGQFNATTENQKKQFMSGLTAQLDGQNAARKDAVSKFNAEQRTSVSKFKADQSMKEAAMIEQTAQFAATLDSHREMFNSTQSAAIEQSNVQWRRQMNQINTAIENQAMQTNTQNAFNLSNQALSMLWQEERDNAQWRSQATENDKDRQNRLEASVLANEAAAGAKVGSTFANILSGINIVDRMIDIAA